MEQKEAIKFFADLFGGVHHIDKSRVRKSGGGWKYAVDEGMDTHDNMLLRRAFEIADRRNINLKILAAGPHMINLVIQDWRIDENNQD